MDCSRRKLCPNSWDLEKLRCCAAGVPSGAAAQEPLVLFPPRIYIHCLAQEVRITVTMHLQHLTGT